MPPKRSAWIGLAWAGSLIGTLALIWFCGFMYWHLRISRLLSDLEYKTGDRQSSGLTPAGSRAFPYLIRELENAVSRNDREAAVVLAWEFDYAIGSADGVLDIYNNLGVNGDSPIESVRELPAKVRHWLDLNREHYPPWWMWWTGKRFTSR